MARAYHLLSRDFGVKSVKAFCGNASNYFYMLAFFSPKTWKAIMMGLFVMARRTSYSWIEGKCVILLCSSGCFSFSEDTNASVGFGYLAQFSSWYIIFSHSLFFCLFNASFLVFNAVDSSIKKILQPGSSWNEKLMALPLNADNSNRKGNKRICRFWCVSFSPASIYCIHI